MSGWLNSAYRARRAERARKRRADPEVRAREAAYQRAYHRKRRTDPEVRARRNEKARERRADPEALARRTAAQQNRQARKAALVPKLEAAIHHVGTQARLAQALGVSQQAVSLWRRNGVPADRMSEIERRVPAAASDDEAEQKRRAEGAEAH